MIKHTAGEMLLPWYGDLIHGAATVVEDKDKKLREIIEYFLANTNLQKVLENAYLAHKRDGDKIDFYSVTRFEPTKCGS